MNWKNLDRGIFLVNVLGIVYDPKTKKIKTKPGHKDIKFNPAKNLLKKIRKG